MAVSAKLVNEYMVHLLQRHQRLSSDPFSEQYLATHTKYNFHSTCKMISKAGINFHISYARKNALISLNYETFQMAFNHQFNLLKGVSHENVLQVKQIIETQNNIYVFYQLYSQKSLSSLLQNQMNLSEIMFYFLQIAHGALCLHEHGIVHGNIQLSNSLVDDNGQVKLSDFNLTRIAYKYQSIKNSQNLQTIYFPPEYDKKVGFQSDVWNCGILLYEMIYKKPPMKYSQYIEKRLGVGKDFRINFEGKKISDQMKKLINSMLQFNEKLRPNMKEVIEKLQKVKQNE